MTRSEWQLFEEAISLLDRWMRTTDDEFGFLKSDTRECRLKIVERTRTSAWEQRITSK